MSKILSWIIGHKLLAFCLVVIIFLIPLLTIYLLYKCKFGIEVLSPLWSSGDILSYIAGFEAMLGSIILGVVAVYQTEKVISISKHSVERERQRAVFERQPCIDANSLYVKQISYNEKYDQDMPVFIDSESMAIDKRNPRFTDIKLYLFAISFRNDSRFDVKIKMTKLQLSSFRGEHADLNFSILSDSCYSSSFFILPQQTKSLAFAVNQTLFESINVSEGVMQLLVLNNIGEEFIYEFRLKLIHLEDALPVMTIGNYKVISLDNIGKVSEFK